MSFSKHAWAVLGFPALAMAVSFFDPDNPAAVPESLSQAGIYSDIVAKTTDTALKYYEVNAPLWSDNAIKKRWIVLPPGRRVPYSDTTDLFDYPDSAMFVKLFQHDSVLNDSTTRFNWETRLLVNRRDAQGHNVWHGFSYKWNKAQTQAYLVGEEGFDTLMTYYPNGLSQPQSYRKWFFPARGGNGCLQCHVQSNGDGRAVLGFFPAQLKRPPTAPIQNGTNQVLWLFSQGVFTGAQPTATQLAARWKSYHEAVPGGLSPLDRFRVIDTMARSYLGANCSGCHGIRGTRNNAHEHNDLEFEFYNFLPTRELGNFPVSDARGIDRPLDPANDTIGDPTGTYKYLQDLSWAGLYVGQGSVWTAQANSVSVLAPGHPASSLFAFRQVARNMPAADSSRLLRTIAGGYDPDTLGPWIFHARWGSKPWRDSIAAHGKTVLTVLNDAGAFGLDNDQMPPLASFEPDTTALKLFGEWIQNYQVLYPVAIAPRPRGASLAASDASPQLRGSLLILPAAWIAPGVSPGGEKARMSGIDGQTHPLSAVGTGRYVLPAGVPSGIYFFRIGKHAFRLSYLR